MAKKQDTYYLAALLIVAVLAFWQVSFFINCLKYDMIDCSYPWRFIVGEHLQQGLLPLWNPYQNLGYPLFADIQSGSSWYLPVWFFGYLFGYNIYILSIEFVLHIFLAGAGMFFLGRTLKFSPFTAFVMGVSYMLSGFFTGNAQHFTLIAGATWFPFVLSSYINLIEAKNWNNIFKTAFFFFLLAAGGYATYTVITVYLLFLIFIAYIIKKIIIKDWQKVWTFTRYNVFLFIASIILSSVVWLSYTDIAPELTRTEGVSIASAMLNPFSPQCSLSFLLPYAVVKNLDFFATDLSMSNAYFGIITFIFFIYSFFTAKNSTYYLFLTLALISLFISFGDISPLRKLLYDYVPFMNMVRFPAVFRLFTIIGFVICAAYGFEFFINDIQNRKRKVLLILSVLLTVFIFIIIFSRFQQYLEIKKFVLHNVFKESASSQFIQHLVFQSAIQFLILTVWGISLFVVSQKKFFLTITGLLVIIEMTLALQLNAPYTIFYSGIKQKDVYAHHKKNFIKGFPIPNMLPVEGNSNTNLAYEPFWRNMTNFHKQISAEGFTSLLLKNFNTLSNKYTNLLDDIKKNPPCFFTGNIARYDNTAQTEELQRVFLEDNDYHILKNELTSKPPSGTLDIFLFKPCKIELNTISNDAQLLVFMQNYYPGWQVHVDGEKGDLIQVNKSLMSVYIPAGQHHIQFEFKKPLIVAGFYITALALLFLCLRALFFQKKIRALIKR